jgi:group I intron endonuclease
MIELLSSKTIPRSFDVPGIYGIRHPRSQRIYIGSSVCVRSRLWQHLRMLNKREHHAAHLQNAWNKYGASQFTLCLIEKVANPSRLVAREQYWMDSLRAYGSGFNSRPRAESMVGVSWRPDQNERRRSSNVIAWSNQALRKQLSRRFLGRHRGNWTNLSKKKSSRSLKAFHHRNPTARLAFRSRVWDSPTARRKRIQGVRASLRHPRVYSARVAQLRKASTSPLRLRNLREAAFRSRDRRRIGITTDSALMKRISQMYESGHSLRQIGKQLLLDHKSVAARLSRLRITITPRYRSGTRHPFAKLTETQVRQIRSRFESGVSQSRLAKEFKVSRPTIADVVGHRSWKQIQ